MCLAESQPNGQAKRDLVCIYPFTICISFPDASFAFDYFFRLDFRAPPARPSHPLRVFSPLLPVMQFAPSLPVMQSQSCTKRRIEERFSVKKFRLICCNNSAIHILNYKIHENKLFLYFCYQIAVCCCFAWIFLNFFWIFSSPFLFKRKK